MKKYCIHFQILLTLKHTNKLNGIVKNTITHDKKIRIFPHVEASLVSLSSAGKIIWKTFFYVVFYPFSFIFFFICVDGKISKLMKYLWWNLEKGKNIRNENNFFLFFWCIFLSKRRSEGKFILQVFWVRRKKSSEVSWERKKKEKIVQAWNMLMMILVFEQW